jgi:hypothetical protein
VNNLTKPSENIRGRFATIVSNLFQEPYLPNSFLILFFIIVITEGVFTLFGQPPGYWRDYDKAVAPLLWLRQLLNLSPWLFAAAMGLYLVIIGAILAVLTRNPALILWLTLCFIHIRNAAAWFRFGLPNAFDITDPVSQSGLHLGLTLIGVSLIGLLISRELLLSQPTANSSQKKSKLSALPVLATASWFLFLTFALAQTITASQVGWRLVVVDQQPPGRINGIIAYDSARERAVLFSGANVWMDRDGLYLTDTWEWDGEKWLDISPAQQPPGRAAHAMAFDENRQVIVLFGGRNSSGPLDDTWEWDGQEWRLRAAANSPPARCCHQLWYDSQRDRIILHGGYDTEQLFYNDTWEWDGEIWTPITNWEHPGPVASGFASAYDPVRNQAVLFLAGWSAGTYLWQDGTWTKPNLTTEPPERASAYMVYNTQQEGIILFGGLHEHRYFDDSWLFDGQTWRLLDTHITPPARYSHAIFFDQKRQRVMLFGGYDGQKYNNDLWELVLKEN